MVLRMCPNVLKNISSLERELTRLDQEEILKIIIFYLSITNFPKQ